MKKYLVLLSLLLFVLVCQSCQHEASDSHPNESTSRSQDKNIAYIVEFGIKSGKLETFTAVMNEMVAYFETSESTTTNYEWYINSDSTYCVLYERYADSHSAMAHGMAFNERFAQRLLPAIDFKRLAIMGNASAELKEATAELNPEFLGPIGGFVR